VGREDRYRASCIMYPEYSVSVQAGKSMDHRMYFLWALEESTYVGEGRKEGTRIGQKKSQRIVSFSQSNLLVREQKELRSEGGTTPTGVSKFTREKGAEIPFLRAMGAYPFFSPWIAGCNRRCIKPELEVNPPSLGTGHPGSKPTPGHKKKAIHTMITDVPY